MAFPASKKTGGSEQAISGPVVCSLKTGSPAEQILKVLHSKSSPELVLVGTQGRRGLKRLLIGSVAEEVIRHARRPVMVIGPVAQEKEQKFINQKQLKFLVPTDLGKNSRDAERYALSLAKRTGGTGRLVSLCGGEFQKDRERWQYAFRMGGAQSR